jgi:hypothetical protein
VAEDKKRFPAPTRPYVPAPSLARVPRAYDPALPSSSGAVWGTTTRILRKDAEFIRQHADVLAAKTTQAQNFKALVTERIAVALKLAELATLPELIEHEWQKGVRDREHVLTMQQIAHQTLETQAMVGLADAQRQLAQYHPAPEPPTPAAAPAAAAPRGLTPADIKAAAQRLPELQPESIETLCIILSGLLAEKNK